MNIENATSKIARGGVFPNEEAFQKIYDECLENAPQAPQKLQDANKALTNAYWDYLAEYEEHTFRYAYQCGYEAALNGTKPEPKPGSNIPWYLLKNLERKAGATV